MCKRLFFFIVVMLMLTTMINAQITTAGINGKVVAQGEPAIGATVLAIHVPSGTRYGAITNDDGRFSFQGMRSGGPYKVEISYVGFQKSSFSGIILQLGESYLLNTTLKASSEILDEIVVIGSRDGMFNSQRTGTAVNFNRNRIENSPSISRSIYDVAKMTPQATVSGSGLSFAGSNNRYNSFQIDGSVNNDVFGLSSSGTNGGQTGANPISLDAIEELQVVIAPFDVRQSGFTGGGINAITKSGTNEFHGSAYGYYNNQNFAGTTAGKDIVDRKKLSEQSDKTYGFTFGGPIIKNKLFFFANAEKTKKTYPSSYNIGDGSNITIDEAKQISDKLMSLTGGDNGGGYGARNINTESTKLLTRIDWNINQANKFTLRYSYLDANQLIFSNSANALRFNNNGYTMNDKTHSLVAELNSRFSNELANELRAGYTRVRDSRDIDGKPIPYVKINLTSSKSVEFGSERYSPANYLNQDVWTLTDNLTWFKGDHTLTAGTHNEFFKFKNLFIRENYGSYVYNSLNDFLSIGTANEVAPYEYNYSFSKEDVTGSKRWAPTFGAAQLGLYLQDDWNVTDLLRLTYGVRMDIPVFFDKPGNNAVFNNSSIAKEYNVATNQMPSSTPMFSPRIGFRWNLDSSRKTLVRGGLGIFTGRIPFVWISNNFSNTGVEYSRTRLQAKDMTSAMTNGFKFQIDPTKQYVPSGTMSSEIDVVDKKFKFPQVFRANLALEHTFDYGIKGSLEGLYSKTMNNVLYKNLAYEESGKYLSNGGDKRPLYKTATNPLKGDAYTKEYTGVIYLTNTSKGYTYSLTAKLEKDFDFGLSTMAAYTYGKSEGLNDGTSSQAVSNWQYNENWQGPNNPEISYSDFDVRHRVIGSISYKKEYAKHFATTVSLFYNGQSGANYSVCYQNNINNDGASGNDVLYVPTDVELATMSFKPNAMTADQQRAALGEWINSNKDIKSLKGHYIPRNGLRSAFENHFDFHLAQDFYVNVCGKRNTIQLSFDILNIGNLLNRSWGIYNAPGNSYTPVSVASVDANGVPTFQFTKPAGDKLYSIADYNSRWRSQIGVKYIF